MLFYIVAYFVITIKPVYVKDYVFLLFLSSFLFFFPVSRTLHAYLTLNSHIKNTPLSPSLLSWKEKEETTMIAMNKGFLSV